MPVRSSAGRRVACVRFSLHCQRQQDVPGAAGCRARGTGGRRPRRRERAGYRRRGRPRSDAWQPAPGRRRAFAARHIPRAGLFRHSRNPRPRRPQALGAVRAGGTAGNYRRYPPRRVPVRARTERLRQDHAVANCGRARRAHLGQRAHRRPQCSRGAAPQVDRLRVSGTRAAAVAHGAGQCAAAVGGEPARAACRRHAARRTASAGAVGRVRRLLPGPVVARHATARRPGARTGPRPGAAVNG